VLLELAELLRCPHPHEDAFLVLSTGAMRDRHLLFGTIGCPVCRAEFPVLEGVARFGDPPHPSGPSRPNLPDPDYVRAVLGLESAGGYVALIGDAGGLAARLPSLEGVHLVCVNPPNDVPHDQGRSLMYAPDFVPLKTGSARGVVVGADHAHPPWLAEAARVLLRGQRVVVLSAAVAPPTGVSAMAAGQGMWVGRRD
jgi:hypothetical protein